MAAFDRIQSGIPSMDEALDNIRLGDNVVWQVTDLEEFKLFMQPYVDQAIADHRNLIYLRFASHEPLLTPREGLRIIPVELTHRFENFTVTIHNIIEEEGYDAFYVFDCLSDLQTAWATDMMMGNFFMVTCPFLFILDTVAFFPILRGRHSFRAIAKIKETTQLFLNVYSDKQTVYVRPEKVWERYSDTMFLAHTYDRESHEFCPILDGLAASRFYQTLRRGRGGGGEISADSWDRFFDDAVRKAQRGEDMTQECRYICNIMMTRDRKLRTLVQKHFTPEDYFRIRERMIGTGMIGGKACGMLLATKIIQNLRPDLYARMEEPDSFFLGSDVFYTYIVHNGFWDIRIRQRKEEEYFSLAETFADHLMNGTFAKDMEDDFVELLEYFGGDPFIVRSSSILEDGFGNAFAGKYESVFCPNVGTIRERLAEFENAIRIVYASTMSLSALDYRKRRGLENRDEQMALLIQRVSGSHYGKYYMPAAAGVGYSYSPYRFMESLDPKAGMLRLVMGLGTMAVDRNEGSYPRIVSLDDPQATPYTCAYDHRRYSQTRIGLIDKEKRALAEAPLRTVEPALPDHLRRMLLTHDFDAERQFRERGRSRSVTFISCDGLVKHDTLMQTLRGILSQIQSEYEYPVDIEYTINLSENGDFLIDLLQCRPLQVSSETEGVEIPETDAAHPPLIECVDASMGLSRNVKLDAIVYIDPVAYYNMPYNDKPTIARLLGKVNWYYRSQEKNLLLLTPGRIGTSSPELGVPTSFADISAFNAICEISESSVGYQPELSYGSHIFQDLVEMNILYNAIFENPQTRHYHPEMLKALPEILSGIVPDAPEGILHLYDVSRESCRLYYDMRSGRFLVTMGQE